MPYANAYLIYRDDFKNRNLKDWMLSHISFAQPPHRYQGNIGLTNDSFWFNGVDTKLETAYRLDIPKTDIQSIHMGYDATFHVFQTRGLGLGWAPIRITLRSNPLNPMYLVVDFNGFSSGNRKFLKTLKTWQNK